MNVEVSDTVWKSIEKFCESNSLGDPHKLVNSLLTSQIYGSLPTPHNKEKDKVDVIVIADAKVTSKKNRNTRKKKELLSTNKITDSSCLLPNSGVENLDNSEKRSTFAQASSGCNKFIDVLSGCHDSGLQVPSEGVKTHKYSPEKDKSRAASRAPLRDGSAVGCNANGCLVSSLSNNSLVEFGSESPSDIEPVIVPEEMQMMTDIPIITILPDIPQESDYKPDCLYDDKLVERKRVRKL